MKKLLVLVTAASLPLFATAGELPEAAVGTYAVLDKNRAPNGFYYRLSKVDGKWVMEGKRPTAANWENISCEVGCEYRQLSESEARSLFPADWQANMEFSCIRNMAQAFCRYSAANDQTKEGYIVVALVTGRPTPIFIRREVTP
ncbi:MAG: hypothetical protein K1X67_14225 [Fimbriimonadaceae bacterium]|nr:hypothetical protein [Fimbriimonadaceae bacterium]